MPENYIHEIPLKLPLNVVCPLKSVTDRYTDYSLRVIVGRRMYPIGRFTLYTNGDFDVVQTAFPTMEAQKRAWSSVLYQVAGVDKLPVDQVYVRHA